MIPCNVHELQRAANTFRRYGHYTDAPPGTKDYIDFWAEELRRCIEGYQVGDLKITGHHYFYLNYCRIVRLSRTNPNSIEVDFPDFWDGDYNFFWALHIAKHGITKEELDKLGLSVKIKHLYGNRHVIVVKARRKGFSYKTAAIVVNTYNTVRNSYCLIGAYDSKYLYPNGTMGMASKYLDFLNEHTGWAKKRQKIDKIYHKRASYLVNERGIQIEKGYMSEIEAVSFHDNPDAARGKDITVALLEEAGKFPNLKHVYTKSVLPACKKGKYYTGQVIIFGTGGSVESNILEDMFWNPDAYDLLPIEHEEEKVGGFFFPATWNLEGFYDECGRSNIKEAEKYILEDRQKAIDSKAPHDVIIAKLHEFPIKPEEAFFSEGVSIFPVGQLREHLAYVMSHNLHMKLAMPAKFFEADGQVLFKPDRSKKPLLMWRDKGEGCPVIWKDKEKGHAYVAGLDPYMHDDGTSLGALYIVDALTGEIVAEYIGRPDTFNKFMYIVELMCRYYNAPLMYENNVPNVKTYFINRGKLNILMRTPDLLIDSAVRRISKNTVKYGIRMTESVKSAGERYINEWLIESDEDGKTNLEKIISPGLLQELIYYKRDGNFDRVMALMMAVFAVYSQSFSAGYVTDEKEELFNKLYNLSMRL
ncbi:MAG: hypothetical protein KatS3mg083_517 [Candidatus Dojkabacteria bacterium]|nr:MAG: hypothetical protein KatS3mg083_517 [Candidatus Dojkabacteria bacterium]